MATRTLDDRLTKYLIDVHSIEVQALAQMKAAPDLAGDDRLARTFAEHLEETREHERLVREQLEERGADTSTLMDIAGRVGGWAMIAFARLNPDTPGKLTAHAFSYEHMELAAYELLRRVAERAGDDDVVELARTVGAQERAMGQRLAACFDTAVAASLREKGAEDIESELVSYLTDAHAIEAQSLKLLEAAPALAGAGELAQVLQKHLDETRGQQCMIEARLRAHDAEPSRLQSTALRIGGANLGAFLAAQPDTPVKLAGFAYAFEHLEIAAYDLLRCVAEQASDGETIAVALQIRGEERAAADRIAESWDAVVNVTLAQLVGEPAV